MKTVFVFVIAAALILLAKSSIVFANTTNCRLAVNCIQKDKCIANKKLLTTIDELEVDPFTILIPGNHF